VRHTTSRMELEDAIRTRRTHKAYGGEPVPRETLEELLEHVLLGAHARGLAGYWRTPAVLRSPEGRAATGVPEGERVLGLIHLGPPRQEKEPPERLPPGDYVTFLP
jgi:nitroreductase